MDKEIGRMYEATNLDQFKMINGNREEVKKRAQKIAKSVEKVGYINAPIIVNEKMEVIDGQARLYFCRATGRPIAYQIIEGLGIEACIEMNISSTNWGIVDYIGSYASRGNASYVLLEKFVKQSPYTLAPTIWALLGTEQGNRGEQIKEGTIEVTSEDYEKGLKIIDYWKRFDDIRTNNRTLFVEAIGYCFKIKDVDNERVYDKIHKFPGEWMTVASITDAIRVIDRVYNDRLGRKGVNVEQKYYEYLDRIFPGFGTATRRKNMR